MHSYGTVEHMSIAAKAMRIFLSLVCIFGLLSVCKATLTIRQGRITNGSGQVSVELIDVVGIASVELGGNPASRPTYFFECTTNLPMNNGSGIRWTRMTTQHRFEVEDIPDGSHGKRLNVGGINYPDLDVYICSDSTSSDVVSVNITGSNPAIMAVKQTVEVMQDESVELEVYVSGYPIPTGSHITWYHLDYSVDESAQEARQVRFQNHHKKLILSNVQPEQAGVYICRVQISISPYLGTKVEIHLQVFAKPTITPFSADIIEQEDDFVYTVPPNHVGSILVCAANGWPIPDVEWQKDGFALPTDSGVISESTVATSNSDASASVTVLARLTWTREFRSLDAGNYKCIMRQRNTSLRAASQSVELKVETVTMYTVTDYPWYSCGVSGRLVHFQIRIVGIDCQNWMMSQKEHISAQVHRELLSAVKSECTCVVGDNELQLIGVPQCSVQMDNAAVFYGRIETNSLAKTKLIFCALSWWQQTSPQLPIDGRFQAVDSSCSMEASPTQNEECAPLGPMAPKMNIKEILAIAGGTGSFITVVILLITITCCIGCYCQSHTRKVNRSNRDGAVCATNRVTQGNHTYDQYSYNGPTSTISEGDEPTYSKLTQRSDKEGYYAQPQWKDGPPAVSPVSNDSSDNLLGCERAGMESGAESLYSYADQLQVQPLKIIYSRNAEQDDDDQLYEQISNLDLQLENDEAQPYSEPVKAISLAT